MAKQRARCKGHTGRGIAQRPGAENIGRTAKSRDRMQRAGVRSRDRGQGAGDTEQEAVAKGPFRGAKGIGQRAGVRGKVQRVQDGG